MVVDGNKEFFSLGDFSAEVDYHFDKVAEGNDAEGDRSDGGEGVFWDSDFGGAGPCEGRGVDDEWQHLLRNLLAERIYSTATDDPFLCLFLILVLVGWHQRESVKTSMTKESNNHSTQRLYRFCMLNLDIDRDVFTA